MQDDDPLSDAARTLYSGPPEDFVRERTVLATAARVAGDRSVAKRIADLHRPTTAASVVNRLVLSDPSTTDRLHEAGDRLRAAQGDPDGIDRDRLRELSIARRALVHDTAARALDLFAPDAGQTVRDEVVATLDAAIADPAIAARLGRLTRAEQWSGLGLVAGAPRADLSVVGGSARPGGTDRARRSDDDAETAAGGSTGPRRRAASQLATSQLATSQLATARLATAEKALAATQDALERADGRAAAARARVEELTAEAERLARLLTRAERKAEQAITAQRAARSRHREAQAAHARVARRTDGGTT